MRLDKTFFQSRVARRIFGLFILCAILPMTVLAMLSFNHVTRQLGEQSRQRLRQASKSMAMTISEHLTLLEAEMKRVTSSIRAGVPLVLDHGFGSPGEGLERRYSGMAVVSESGQVTNLLGEVSDTGSPTDAERAHLRGGRTLLSGSYRSGLPPRVLLRVMVDPDRPAQGDLLVVVEATFLWGWADDNPLPPATEVCILDDTDRVLFASHPVTETFTRQVWIAEESKRARPEQYSGRFEWSNDEKTYLANYWSLFLKSSFHVQRWTVVASESKDHVFAAMNNFKRNFVFVFLMTLWIVLLFSISQIRKRLVPLHDLQVATRQIAQKNFGQRVTVFSGDEFEELAESFNTMAVRLGKQFHALTAISEIDRTILSTLDTTTIVETVLQRMPDVLPCDDIGVILADRQDGVLKIFTRNGDAAGVPSEAPGFTKEELRELRDNPDTLDAGSDEIPRYLRPLAEAGSRSFLLLPMVIQGEAVGVIALGSVEPLQRSRGDLLRGRQLADQVAVALSNARLLEELDQLNWGTLTALAWAIDASSPWTAGHSENGARLAVKIGKVMGLPRDELDNLHRGGLLHDIGKIGISPNILNKTGRLTSEERRTMQEHVLVGARILEPIKAYAGVLPVVRQHHEWFDGNGYPQGLAGEAIDVKARIFAVADCYDALVSDRPYRPAVGREQAIKHIRAGAGTQFDPKVVEVFLSVMAKDAEGDEDSGFGRRSLLRTLESIEE